MSGRTSKKAETAEPHSIEALRAQIDEINLKILRLLSLRGTLATQIGQLKHGDGSVVYLPVRERQVIEKMIAENPGPLKPAHIRAIYTEIISACRALEHPTRVAFLGPEHTYSHEAALERFGASAEFVPESSVAAVFQAIENGRADLGVVPVENSTEG
ncbi:MAG TPA: chorismate mutase, partial [Candidatus Binataceae bacterium]